MRRLPNRLAVLILMCVVFVGVVGIFSLRARSIQIEENNTALLAAGYPMSPVWQVRPQQATAQNSQGVFDVNAVLVTSQEIVLFYVINSNVGEVPSVSSTTYLPDEVSSRAPEEASFSQVSAVEALGRVSGYEAGAIHIPYNNKPGQVIALNITLKDIGAVWYIEPLQQLTDAPNKETVQFFPVQNKLSPLVYVLGRLGGEHTYATLKIHLQQGETAHTPALFLQVDRQTIISRITESAFNASVFPNGAFEVNSPVNNQGYVATPAPLEQP